jgi:hypothetical protein
LQRDRKWIRPANEQRHRSLDVSIRSTDRVADTGGGGRYFGARCETSSPRLIWRKTLAASRC